MLATRKRSQRLAVRRRSFSAEFLEVRTLLSTVAGEDIATGQSSSELSSFHSDSFQSVQLIELESNDGDGNDLPLDQLPSLVQASVAERFPGAIVENASIDLADEQPHVTVDLNWFGTNLEVALAMDGTVIEIEEPLHSSDVPVVLRNWISSEFPGAEILRVERVIFGSALDFEIEFVTSTAESMEATFRLQNSGGDLITALTPDSLPVDVQLAPSDVDKTRSRIVARSPEVAAAEKVALKESSGLTEQVSVSQGASMNRGVISSPDETDEPWLHHLAEVIAEAGRSASPFVPVIVQAVTMTVPLTVEGLSNALPVNPDQIAQAMQQFLDDINALMPEIPTSQDVLSWTPHVALGIAAVYGIQRLVVEHRARVQPVLRTASKRSTWSWVLNLSTDEDS